MPNGDHMMSKKDWEKVKTFFNGISGILIKFANDFNLMIDKYYHHSKSWAFRFKHPKGGSATVFLYYEGNEKCYVENAWHIDEYETFTCYFKYGAKNYFNPSDIDIYDMLGKKLREVVAWDKDALTPQKGYKNPWGKYSKDEWLKIYNVDKYPLVKIDAD